MMKKSNATAAAALPSGKKWAPRPPLESQIQQQCVRWFQMQHRRLWLDGMLFHIANEGVRPGAMGRRSRREGVVRGVADLCLALPRHGCGALYIEMKRPGSYQTPEQRAWQRAAEAHGNRYVVCRSLDEFIAAVEDYLAPDPAAAPAPTKSVCFRSELQLGVLPENAPKSRLTRRKSRNGKFTHPTPKTRQNAIQREITAIPTNHQSLITNH